MYTDQGNPTDNRRWRHRREEKNDRHIALRNILNLIFMIGAVIGVIVYYKWSHDVGTIIILISMIFKIVECVFRFMK